jgi:hypothetical protein
VTISPVGLVAFLAVRSARARTALNPAAHALTR